MTDQGGPYADEFWAALDSGRLKLTACRDCDSVFFPPGRFCPHCHSEAIGWRVIEEPESLYAYSWQQVTPPGVPAPVTLGLVELEPGVRIMARVDSDFEALSIGMELALVSRERADGTDSDGNVRIIVAVPPSEE